jgi:hypothetical protein
MTLLPNSDAAVIFPESTKPEVVIASLEIIISDLKLRVNKKRRKAL